VTSVWRNRSIGLAIAALVFALDQAIKYWVTDTLRLEERGLIGVVAIFDLRWVENYGVSLGMFQATSPEMRWGLVALTAAIACVVAVWMLREKLLGEIVGLALILGGALGNIIDRFRFGYVVDYADLHFGEWRPFFVFNLADAAITIGVVIILLRAFFVREPQEDETPPARNVPSPEN
jgi:signal peptidase II